MNRTIGTIALAVPLTTIALSLGATPAMAEPTGPEDLTLEIQGDPEPRPEIDDKAPLPEDPERPDGPGDIKDNDPCPTHGPCGDGPDDEKDPDDGDDGGNGGEKHPSDSPKEIPVPTRIDAGSGSTADGLELSWVIAGGALVTATGLASAARRRSAART